MQRHPGRAIEICSPCVRQRQVESFEPCIPSPLRLFQRRQDRSSKIKFRGESISRTVKKKRKREKIEESLTLGGGERAPTKIRAYCEGETELLTRQTFLLAVDVLPTSAK